MGCNIYWGSKMSSILNITTQILSYSDNVGNTDNPLQRNFDWGRRLVGLVIEKPDQKEASIAPGATMTVFNSAVSTGLAALDNLSLAYEGNSVYSLKVNSGSGSFRAARTVTGIVGNQATVSISNNAIARFTFDVSADLTAVQYGDTMRIASLNTHDDSPFGFNDINSGSWIVLAVGPNYVDVYRGPNELCDGINETVPAVLANDVKFFSSAGVQAGDTLSIAGSFSPVSFGQFEVIDVTADTLYFTSTKPLPDQDVLYTLNTISIFGDAKQYLYLETDQSIIVRLNADTTDNNMVDPIVAGDPWQVGFLHKTGLVYKIEIVNKSMTTANVRYFTVE